MYWTGPQFLTSKTACALVIDCSESLVTDRETDNDRDRTEDQHVGGEGEEEEGLELVSTILVGNRYEGHVRPWFTVFAFVLDQLDGHHYGMTDSR
jgi:hypothetical protein